MSLRPVYVTCTCMCAIQNSHVYFFKWVCICVKHNQFANVHLTQLTGHRISWQFIGIRSCVLCRADRHLHTYNNLRFTVVPCHPHHLFLAAVSLALLSFPPTPPCCASLPLPLLLCFKSSSFPLSVILPIPPLFPSSLSPLSPCVCQNEWQVSLPDAKLYGRRLWWWLDMQHVYVPSFLFLFFIFCVSVCVHIMTGVEGWQGDRRGRWLL